MSQQQTTAAKFACDSCGRSYAWKAELAGRKVKCKCGHVLEVPASAPQEEQESYDLADEPAAREADAAQAPAVPQSGTGYRCPNCLGDLIPGTHLCKACGFNLRTGLLERAPRSSAGAATAMATGKRGPMAKGAVARPAPVKRLSPQEQLRADAEKSRTMKQVGMGALLLLLVIGGIWGAKNYLNSGGDSGGGSDVAKLGDDAEAEELMRDSSPVEARKFLQDHESRSIGQLVRSKGMFTINRIYQVGAVKVWAFADGLTATRLVAECPTDPEKRKELFNWSKTWQTERMMKAPKDVGQKYIILDM